MKAINNGGILIWNVFSARICSIHFGADNFEITLKQRLLNYTPINSRQLKRDAVPTLNLPGVHKRKNCEREQRLDKRRRREEVAVILKTAADDALEFPSNADSAPGSCTQL